MREERAGRREGGEGGKGGRREWEGKDERMGREGG